MKLSPWIQQHVISMIVRFWLVRLNLQNGSQDSMIVWNSSINATSQLNQLCSLLMKLLGLFYSTYFVKKVIKKKKNVYTWQKLFWKNCKNFWALEYLLPRMITLKLLISSMSNEHALGTVQSMQLWLSQILRTSFSRSMYCWTFNTSHIM